MEFFLLNVLNYYKCRTKSLLNNQRFRPKVRSFFSVGYLSVINPQLFYKFLLITLSLRYNIRRTPNEKKRYKDSIG